MGIGKINPRVGCTCSYFQCRFRTKLSNLPYLRTTYFQLPDSSIRMVLTILNLIKTPSPDDASNKKKLLKQVLVELVATTVFVYFGTMSAISTGA